MPYLTLTLNGQPVDLPADAAVALSYRANDLTNLDSREAAFSETITLPLTARNVAALGSPHSLDSLTAAPYRLLPAVLTSPGGAVLLDGYGILELSHDGFDVTLTNALGGLLRQVGERSLRELDLSAYDHALSYEAIAAAAGRPLPTPYTYALADTGVLVPRPAEAAMGYDEVPAVVFVSTLLQALLLAPLPPAPLPPDYVAPTHVLAGYRLAGSLLAEPTYQAMVVPRATLYPQLRAGYLDPYTMRAYAAPRQYTNQNVDIQFGNVATGSLFAGVYYTPPPHAIGFRAEAYLPISQLGAGSEISLYADHQGYVGPDAPANGAGHTLLHRQQIDDDFGTGVISFDVQLPYVACNPTTQIYLRLESAGNTRIMLRAGAYFALTPLPRALPGAPVHLEASLPDLRQADLLKLLWNQFNLIIQLDPVRKLVQLDLFNQLEKRRNEPVDWSEKIDLTRRPRLAYRLGDYAQRNRLTYAQYPAAYNPELAIPLPPADINARGAGLLLAANSTLPTTAEVYKSDFALPLPHLTAQASESLPWLPFFKGTGYGLGSKDEAKKPPSRWDSERDYDNGAELVLYRGQTWQNIVGTDKTTRARPPVGEYYFSTDQAWQLAADAYEVANDELATVAVLVPYTGPRRISSEGEHGPDFVPAYTLARTGLPFADLLPAYYPGLSAALARVRVLTLDMRLNAFDLANLDFTRPVRLKLENWPGYGKLSVLAYLNLIDEYLPGLPGSVPCTFLVLGDRVPGLAPPVPFPMPTTRTGFIREAGDYYLLSEQGYYLLTEAD